MPPGNRGVGGTLAGSAVFICDIRPNQTIFVVNITVWYDSVSAMLRNWKTSIAGLLTALFGFVVFSPETFTHALWLVALSKYATAGGLACLGVLAGDSRKDAP